MAYIVNEYDHVRLPSEYIAKTWTVAVMQSLIWMHSVWYIASRLSYMCGLMASLFVLPLPIILKKIP